MKRWLIWLALGGMLGGIPSGCGNPCEALFQRCESCNSAIDEDRCKSTSAFNNWGACGDVLNDFNERDVCNPEQ